MIHSTANNIYKQKSLHLLNRIQYKVYSSGNLFNPTVKQQIPQLSSAFKKSIYQEQPDEGYLNSYN